nr:M48 family metalloprotease [Aquabacterium terrae]
MRRRLRGPRVHQVLLVDEVNAAIVQRPLFGLIGWPRNHLLLGLPLLDSLAPDEALAVVAHEYGHLAGSHGRFAAFIYRLRLTWATIDALASQWQGFAGRALRRLVGWYAPYFNAYTHVLARANEYQADRASVDLVGAAAAAAALKRVNLAGAHHEAFYGQVFERVIHDARPPADLQQRWAEVSAQAATQPNAQRWLGDALDREGGVLDTHPPLRARLAALPGAAAALQEMPPPHTGPSAAEAWLGALLPALRQQLQQAWTERIAEPWAERHQQAQQQRNRLAALRAQAALNDDEAFECLRLRAQLEPAPELATAVADFNAGHVDHAPALYLEGTLRLDAGDAAGLTLIERAMALDADAIKPGCERCHAFFAERRDSAQAEVYAERWRRRDTLERERAEQLGRLDHGHALAPAELDAATRLRVDELLAALGSFKPAAVYLVRRTLPADPSFPAYVLALEFGWWARRGRRPQQALDRAAAYEWPLPLMICLLDRQPAAWQRRLRAVRGARRRCASLAR